MTLTQHAHINRFLTSNFNFDFFFLMFYQCSPYPRHGKGRLKQEIIEAAKEAAVEEAMRISADPLPVGAGDWQGCEGNGDEEGTAD